MNASNLIQLFDKYQFKLLNIALEASKGNRISEIHEARIGDSLAIASKIITEWTRLRRYYFVYLERNRVIY